MTADTVIATHALTKRYRDVLAVDGLDLDVRRGEVYGFLGRNGAGKTTTIRMLLGLIRPTGGEVTVLGRRITPGETSVFGRIGYLVETATAYPNLTVRENLDIQRRLTGAPRTAVAEAIELLRLGAYADRRAGQLSLGNKQRLSLARALLHAPDVLVLDEPANALDPAGIVEIRELLRSLADERGVDRLHVEPHPRRGRAPRRPHRHRARRPSDRGARPRRTRREGERRSLRWGRTIPHAPRRSCATPASRRSSAARRPRVRCASSTLLTAGPRSHACSSAPASTSPR